MKSVALSLRSAFDEGTWFEYHLEKPCNPAKCVLRRSLNLNARRDNENSWTNTWTRACRLSGTQAQALYHPWGRCFRLHLLGVMGCHTKSFSLLWGIRNEKGRPGQDAPERSRARHPP